MGGGERIEMSTFTEKRKFKRLGMSIPIALRHVTSDGKEQRMEGLTSDVSYNGAFVRDVASKSLKLDDSLQISLTVPRDNTRDFPFSRLIGKARVVRVERDGVAFEFNEDINRLFVAS